MQPAAPCYFPVEVARGVSIHVLFLTVRTACVATDTKLAQHLHGKPLIFVVFTLSNKPPVDMSHRLLLYGLFTRRELWYHCLMMPILFPVGSYLFLHERYFTDATVFGWGTLLVSGLYWFSLIVLTAAVKGVFRHYPDLRQVRQRNLIAMLVATTLTAGLAIFDVWTYSLVPLFERPFNWGTVRAILLLGLVFDALLCFVLGIQYTYGRWQENQTEKEQLKSAVLQQQLDALRQQINPHFLFNSLNSISALITDYPQQAGFFVDELAKVYRYMLQANTRDRATLADEIMFIQSYGQLLAFRYGAALSVQINTAPVYDTALLPPMTLQILLDYLIQHNCLSPQKPLCIYIDTTPTGWLCIRHNPQPRQVWVDRHLPGYDDIYARYRTIGAALPTQSITPAGQQILLPLLTESCNPTLPLSNSPNLNDS